jgi:hypothetical protein
MESFRSEWAHGGLTLQDGDIDEVLVGRDSVRLAADRRLEVEINDLARRVRTVATTLTPLQRKHMLQSLGVDENIMRGAAFDAAQAEFATQLRSLKPTVVTVGSNIAYREVAELFKLVNAIKDKVLEEAESGSIAVFQEGISVKDLASFTNAVNNLYGTYMKSKDMAQLYEDINKITEALKEAMKEMPRSSVDKFMKILASFD